MKMVLSQIMLRRRMKRWSKIADNGYSVREYLREQVRRDTDPGRYLPILYLARKPLKYHGTWYQKGNEFKRLAVRYDD